MARGFADSLPVFTVSGGTTVTVSGLALIGGGIDNAGALTVKNLSITGAETAGDGSALLNEASGTLTVADSAIADNGGGSAVFNEGALTLTDSTIADNQGGGILHFAGTLTVRDCTIAGNTAMRPGAGIANWVAGASVTVQNTIVALNQDPTGPDPDVAGAFISLGHNLIGDDDGSSGFGAAGDQVGSSAAPIDPRLGPLQNNGGPTQTMALLAGSPAVDAGDNAAAPGPTTSAAAASPASSTRSSTSGPSSRRPS